MKVYLFIRTAKNIFDSYLICFISLMYFLINIYAECCNFLITFYVGHNMVFRLLEIMFENILVIILQNYFSVAHVHVDVT